MIYTIKQGRHRADHYLSDRLMKGNVLRFSFIIHSEDIGGVNSGVSKIYGFSEPFVHRNSIRLAVRQNKDHTLTALAYAYCNGRSPNKHPVQKLTLCRIVPNEPYWVEIESYPYKYEITLRDTSGDRIVKYSATIHKDKSWVPFRLKCHPYIGGNDPADKDVRIEIIDMS